MFEMKKSQSIARAAIPSRIMTRGHSIDVQPHCSSRNFKSSLTRIRQKEDSKTSLTPDLLMWDCITF
ncbi:hypothetical protein ACU8KH_01216 [Lachancea thermotolerans]